MLAFCGLWSGGILIFAVERTYQWGLMSIPQYAVDFRRSVRRVDPLMPILGAAAGIGATVFALSRHGPAASLGWATVGLIVLVMILSVTVAEPINSKFRRLPEGSVPDGAESLRANWRRFHLVRTVAALGALATAAAAATA